MHKESIGRQFFVILATLKISVKKQLIQVIMHLVMLHQFGVDKKVDLNSFFKLIIEQLIIFYRLLGRGEENSVPTTPIPNTIATRGYFLQMFFTTFDSPMLSSIPDEIDHRQS